MTQRIFLAGATGAIGRPLTRLLRAAGHTVIGTTRSAEKAAMLRQEGIEAAVVDVFDAEALRQAVLASSPDIVIHQLTDLPANLDPAQMAAAIARNARIREEGTRNLASAAQAAGVRRLIVQSIAWAYAPGSLPHREADPLDAAAEGLRRISVGGVIALEQQTLATGIPGIILRYGHLYGPATGAETPAAGPAVHVDAAAAAALLAIDHGSAGAYNIAEPNDDVATDKAHRELGWRHDFRVPVA